MTKDDWSLLERQRNLNWYRNQAVRMHTNLVSYLQDNPGRATKARKAIVEAREELGRRFSNEADAYEAICEVEKMGWQAPKSAARVIAKALGKTGPIYTEHYPAR